MRTRACFTCLAVLSIALAVCRSNIAAQSAPRRDSSPSSAAFDPRDLGGVWSGGIRINKVSPMLPGAQAKFDENTSELKLGRPITKNPAFTCHPPGIPHAYNNGAFPIEIVQTPKRTFVFFESAHHWRAIWTDGREIPKESDPLYMGYSVGHWQGNDFVVETAHFNDLTWLDAAGHPHSEALRVTERFRRVDRETLQIEITINDPLSYTVPWTMTGNFKLRPNWEIAEAFCVLEDQTNFHEVILAPNAKP